MAAKKTSQWILDCDHDVDGVKRKVMVVLKNENEDVQNDDAEPDYWPPEEAC